MKRKRFSGLEHQSSCNAGGFQFKVIPWGFLASYLVQSLLPCPGSRNGKLVDTVSRNESIKMALTNIRNEKGKEDGA